MERRLREELERREDVFKDCKPYFGDVLSDVLLGDSPPGEVHSLYVLSLRTVLRARVPYERCDVPTVIRKRLDVYRRLVQWPGPKIMKCSRCGKFYTEQEKFDHHKCNQHHH